MQDDLDLAQTPHRLFSYGAAQILYRRIQDKPISKPEESPSKRTDTCGMYIPMPEQ